MRVTIKQRDRAAVRLKTISYSGATKETQAGAEGGANNLPYMTSLRTKQQIDARIATDATPDTDDEKLSTPADIIGRAERADWTPALPATYTRPIGEKLKEHRSILEWIDPDDHAAVRAGTFSGDLNDEFDEMLDSGERHIFWPAGTYPLALDGYSPVSTLDGIDFYGEGAGRSIIPNVSLTAAARPLFISTGADAVLRALDFRHNATLMTQPTMAGGQIAFGSAVLMMGDKARTENLRVRNAWDNGIAFGRYDLTTGTQTDGSPQSPIAFACETYRCGDGAQTITAGAPSAQPFNAGGGINVLTASFASVIACRDIESTQGFILDYASSAQGNFIACSSFGARKSRVGTYGSLDATPGGQGFYIGARGNVRNCYVLDPQGDGIWLDGYSHDCDVSVHVKGAQQRAALVQGRDSRVSVKAESCSQRGSGLYDAVTARGSAATAIDVFTNSTGMVLDVHATGSLHRDGLRVEHSPYEFQGVLKSGGNLTGVNSAYNNERPDLFLAFEYTEGAGGRAQSFGQQLVANENASYIAEPFGDSEGNGTLTLASSETPAKSLAMGYDPINDLAVIQGIHAGVAKKPLGLNPSGGDVIAGIGSWDEGALRLGSHYFWIDGSGGFRTKSSAPSSDTDGGLVGGSVNAELANYTPAGAGASIRIIRDKLRDTVSVKDYGAVLDGSADAEPAITSAATQVGAFGSITIQKGTLLLDSTPTAPDRLLIGDAATFTGAGAPPGVTDLSALSVSGRWHAMDMTQAGGAGAGSANQHAVAFQVVGEPTASTAAYQKNAIYARVRQLDPSGGGVERDLVAAQHMAFIGAGNSTGRAWATHSIAWVETTADGLVYGHEIEVYNNGSTQTAIDTATSKYGSHWVASAGRITAGLLVSTKDGSSQFHNLIYAKAAAITEGVLRVDDTFVLDKFGRIAVGHVAPLAVLHAKFGASDATLPRVTLETANAATSSFVDFLHTATRAHSIGLDNASGEFRITSEQGVGGSSLFRAISNTHLAFRGDTPVARPTVTGSRGANAALASLLTALASQGLITDSTS